MVFLVPMFAGSFTIGMALAKDIQVSNVARDAVVLMVRAVTDPESGLDLVADSEPADYRRGGFRAGNEFRCPAGSQFNR